MAQKKEPFGHGETRSTIQETSHRSVLTMLKSERNSSLLHLDVKPPMGTTGFSFSELGAGVRDGDYTSMWLLTSAVTAQT
jgi:hypothetical protein